MRIESSDFKDNGFLPKKFTCDGENVPPHLKWKDFPEKTKSFALTIRDPDAPSGDFKHWLVFDIPKDVHEIKNSLPENAREIENDSGERSYMGPCPPSGVHKYIFSIFALDVENLAAGRDDFFGKLEKHKIDSAKIVGLYER